MTEISLAAVDSLQWLDRLAHSGNLAKYESEVPEPLWEDELGRLRVWAANIGAHRTDQSSLDFRLRDSSHVRQTVLRVLERLRRTMQDLEDVVEGLDVGEDPVSDFSDSESENDEKTENSDGKTEIQSIYYALRDSVTSLLQLSMTIRQPAHRDRLLGTRRSDTAMFEPFDKDHVFNKFPTADPTILSRLGQAISQRRAILRYRERHHAKLTRGISRAFNDHADTESTAMSDTIATEFVELLGPEPLSDDQRTVASQTSYAQSLVWGSGGISIPPTPEGFESDVPFECPYCFCIVSMPSTLGWARHVFNDLMPYVCIFPDCPTPRRLYHSRREWFYHLNNQHSATMKSGSETDCALCQSSLANPKSLERHLGRHLEELALFALPHVDADNDQEVVDFSDVSVNSNDEDIEGSVHEYGASPIPGVGYGSSQQQNLASDGASLVDELAREEPTTKSHENGLNVQSIGSSQSPTLTGSEQAWNVSSSGLQSEASSTPLFLRQEQNGVHWLAFEYLRDQVKIEYTIRCDIDFVRAETLDNHFRSLNRIHRDAGSAHKMQSNAIGWALADLNPALRENPTLLSHAVSCFRQAGLVRLARRGSSPLGENRRDPSRESTDDNSSTPPTNEASVLPGLPALDHAGAPARGDGSKDTNDEGLYTSATSPRRDRPIGNDVEHSLEQSRHPRSESNEGETTSELSRSDEQEEDHKPAPPSPLKPDSHLKSILKPPRASFPEDAIPIREGTAPRDDTKMRPGVPHDANWTKIDRRLVSPEALDTGDEPYEVRPDYVIVLRVLSKEEIQMYAAKTEEIRAEEGESNEQYE